MLKIHHLVLSRSDRIVWLAEELAIPYEMVFHARDPETFRAPESLRAVMPLAKAPVIQHGADTVAESALICDYLLDRYGNGRLRPASGTPERLQYDCWKHCSESTLMYPGLIDVLCGLTKSEAPGLMAFAMNEYRLMFGYVEQSLAHDYIAGAEFTAADIMVYYTIALGAGIAIPFESHAPLDEYPRIKAYLARMEQRPAWQKAAKLCAAPSA